MGTLIVNQYLNIRFLLDTFPGAAAAYSLRQLSSTTTNVVRVRRSSDNLEQDFTASNINNGTLATWVGAGNDGFVRTWYDQSGNNNDAIQVSTSLQPLLVSNGVVLSDGIKFDGVNDYLDCQAMLWSPTGAQSTFVVVKAEESLSNLGSIVTQYSSSIEGRTWIFANPSTGFGFFSAGTQNLLVYPGQFDAAKHIISITQPDSNNALASFDGSITTGSGSGISRYQRNTFIGGGIGGSESSLLGFLSEIVIYQSDQAANLSLIEENINNYYNVF